MTKLKSFIIRHLSFRKGKLARLIRLLDVRLRLLFHLVYWSLTLFKLSWGNFDDFSEDDLRPLQ